MYRRPVLADLSSESMKILIFVSDCFAGRGEQADERKGV